MLCMEGCIGEGNLIIYCRMAGLKGFAKLDYLLLQNPKLAGDGHE